MRKQRLLEIILLAELTAIFVNICWLILFPSARFNFDLIAFFYLAPFLPILPRAFIVCRYTDIKREPLNKAEMAREANRASILAFSGFSFAGIIALTIFVSEHPQHINEVELPAFYLIVSFLCYILALNIQDYKYWITRAEIGSALKDIATLSILCAAFFACLRANYRFSQIAVACAIGGWLLDHFTRCRYIYEDYQIVRKRKADREAETAKAKAAAV